MLGQYDIVFAKARCALEALAVGNAVVLCDTVGVGPMVTTGEVDRLRRLNFGVRALREATTRGVEKGDRALRRATMPPKFRDAFAQVPDASTPSIRSSRFITTSCASLRKSARAISMPRRVLRLPICSNWQGTRKPARPISQLANLPLAQATAQLRSAAYSVRWRIDCRLGPPWPRVRKNSTQGWPRRATPSNSHKSASFHSPEFCRRTLRFVRNFSSICLSGGRKVEWRQHQVEVAEVSGANVCSSGHSGIGICEQIRGSTSLEVFDRCGNVPV